MSYWCAKNCLRYCASANSLCTPSLSASVGISLIDWTLDVSTRSPLSVETCPMNGTSFSRIVSLYVLSVSPWSLQRPKDIMVAVGFFDCVATPNYNEVIRYYFNSLRFFCEFMDLTLKHFRSWDDPKQEPSRMLPSKWGVEDCEEIRCFLQRHVPEHISVIQFGE